jgi:hypothetical protein
MYDIFSLYDAHGIKIDLHEPDPFDAYDDYHHDDSFHHPYQEELYYHDPYEGFGVQGINIGGTDDDLYTSNLGGTIIGDPSSEIDYIQMQEGLYSCAVASQKGIIESILGKEIPEIELSYDAYSHGWYNPSAGTMPEHTGKILEEYGIPVDRGFERSITDLAEALQNGEKVMVGLDASEIWNGRIDMDGNPMELPNQGHVVWVTGIVEDDSGHWSVVMNDSGIPNGAGEVVPLEHFLNAWEDYGNFAVITNTQQFDNDSTDLASLQDHLQQDSVSFGGYYYTGPNGEKLYKAGDGHIYDINNNKVG